VKSSKDYERIANISGLEISEILQMKESPPPIVDTNRITMTYFWDTNLLEEK